MKTCIIIPCYNEEDRLPYDEFCIFIKNELEIDFCFANDGSTDKTILLLKKIKEEFPERVKIFDYAKNTGKAETVRKSMLEILKEKNHEFIGFFDADLATPLSEIKMFQREFSNKPELLLVMGSRFKRLGANIDRRFKRFLFGRIFATIISHFVLKFPVYDTQCGAKLFSKKIPISVFENPFYTKWIFDVEILLKLKKNEEVDILKSVIELPLNVWIEKGGSKIKLLDLFKIPIDILRLYRIS